jgi:glycosyltransferase involved in cell wall biosynthesis
MKILYTCTYSAGISGVWNRVYNLAKEMIKKGHDVYVFSSNLEAGTFKEVPEHEEVEGIKIFRFKVTKFGSKNAYLYNSRELRKKFNEIMPNVVDCQTYRHSEGNIISGEAEKAGVPCFLTTHAPFMNSGVRGKWLSLLSWGYDLLIGRRVLKRFKKVIAISKWEYPHLNKLGVEDERIAYIPNGIPSEFFKDKRFMSDKVRKILFFGRIAPVKDVETLLDAWSLIEKEHPYVYLEIIGPAETDYLRKLEKMIGELGLKNIVFRPAVFELNKKIQAYNGSEIFVLPSRREGMPQSLIEAMSRGDIVVASDITACKEIVKSGKNGFLFKQRDAADLAKRIDFVIANYRKLGEVVERAKKDASSFRWDILADKLEKLYKS